MAKELFDVSSAREGEIKDAINAAVQRMAMDMHERPDAKGKRKVTIDIVAEEDNGIVMLEFTTKLALPPNPSSKAVGYLGKDGSMKARPDDVDEVMRPTLVKKAANGGDK